ncbi:unnamed protein product [Dibothriocephalus latus]|uniref:Uncharacterized protein n=1 Tax=Dibothriocephalus latus TaxID=60516 RepID=A0A3P6PM25_DIBLA|nr:unnamed protein product [Dibothriocephalus latus]
MLSVSKKTHTCGSENATDIQAHYLNDAGYLGSILIVLANVPHSKDNCTADDVTTLAKAARKISTTQTLYSDLGVKLPKASDHPDTHSSPLFLSHARLKIPMTWLGPASSHRVFNDKQITPLPAELAPASLLVPK